VTAFFEYLAAEYKAAGDSLEFVINEVYTERVRALAAHARKNSNTTGEPAYRMPQMLTRLRGGEFRF
jgi:hypothetical protein